MKVIFDENVPAPLRKFLDHHVVTTVQEQGLGGHIKIVSFAGEGTTVVLTVPAHRGAHETGLPVTEFFDTI